MKQLTVFTTTYNRAYLLPQLYNSLCGQSNPNFIWLVVDDGSTDNTRELVASWIRDAVLEIRYIYQDNQGMHGGHNTAYANIETTWNTCIDSDDYMPPNAVEIILEHIDGVGEGYAGFAGLDIDKNGNIIGSEFPEGLHESNLLDIYNKHHIKGDKKLVYKTAIVRKYPPYPLFKNENFVPLSYLYYLIDQDYKLKLINKPLVVVEYQTDGSTKNMLRQYRRNPRGFAFARKSALTIGISLKDDFKNLVHIVSSFLFTKDLTMLRSLRKPLLLIIAIPFGVMLNIHVRMKTGNFSA